MYYFYRLLSLLKAAVGYFITQGVKLYNYLAIKIRAGAEKEVERIAKQRDKAIQKAEQMVVQAESMLEVARTLAKEEEEIAQQKAFKKHVKVAQKLQ